MSQGQEPRSEFRLILNSVRTETVQAVAQELTNLFPLDLPTAMALLRDTPIILLDRLTPLQARSVGSYALRLKALGADVQVTSQPVGKLRVARWPILPDIAKRPGNHVICPNCGARLQMVVHIPPIEAGSSGAEGGVQAAESEAGGVSGGTGPASAAPQAPVQASMQAGAQAIRAGSGRVGGQGGLATGGQAKAAGGGGGAVQAGPRAAVATGGQAVRAPGPPPIRVPQAPRIAAPSRVAAPAASQLEEVVLEPVMEPEAIEISDEAVVLEPEVAAEVEVEPSARVAPPSTPGKPVGGGGSCSVILVGKIRGEKKKGACQLMAYYLGITEDEATVELSRRSFVTVAKDLTPEQAAECQQRYEEIGVKVNIKG